MQFTVWLSFVAATVVFGLIPGPSVCFTIAHALKHGARRTLPTILGQLAANCCQIVVVLFGINRILERSEVLFNMLKIAGAIYLVYLGYCQWTARRPHVDAKHSGSSTTAIRAFTDGFVVCGTNPKAFMYFGALLPQFVVPGFNENTQLVILSVTNLAIAALVLILYTVLADRVGHWFDAGKYWKAQNRLAGAMMIIAGVALSIISKS